MKQLLLMWMSVLISLFMGNTSSAQVSVTGRTNTTPNLAASYTSLANAITALNTITAISGQVTLTATSAETAPAGGYSITATPTGISATNNIIIDGSASYYTITANSSLTSGSLTDAIFKIIGADYINITRFTMRENSANTTTAVATNNMTEWGVALLRASTTNGAQYNSIIDNDIQLDRTYPNTFGIYSNVRHTSTNVNPSPAIDIANGTTGPNHGTKVYSNRISNINMGIVFIGSNTDDRMDNYTDVGGTSSSTGNAVTNWGGNSLPTATFAGNMGLQYSGILMRCEKNDNISWNTVTGSTSVSGSVAAPIRGIHNGTATSAVTGTFTTTIEHNTVTITDNLPNGSSSTSRVDGIICTDKLGSGTLSIRYNTISGLAVTASGSNRSIKCISNSASATNVYIDSNMIVNNTSTATASAGSFVAIEQTGTVTSTIEINYNSIGDSARALPAISYSATANAAATLAGINNAPTSNPGGTASISINNNCFYGFVTVNSPANKHAYINCDHTTTTNSVIHIDHNHFINLVARTAGDVIFIGSSGTMAASVGALMSVSYNDIIGAFTKSLGSSDVYLFNGNGSSGTGNNMTETGNNFSNISLTGTTLMHGWYDNEGATVAGPVKSITNNVFENWTCGTTGSVAVNGVYCDWASGNSEISGNRIGNITAAADVNGILSASTTAARMAVSGNNISELKTTSSSAEIVGTNFSGLSAYTPCHNNLWLNTTVSGGSMFGYKFTATTSSNSIDASYNSSYVKLTSGSTNTAPIRVTASSAGKIYIRNNIFVNESSNSGIAAAIWWSSTSIANLDASSDNNVLYVTPGTNHYIFYDGTTNYATLALYQAHTATDAHSLQQKPVFSSLSTLTLSPFPDNYLILNGGRNDGAALGIDVVPDDFQTNPRMTGVPFITDIGRDQVNQVYVNNIWTGAAGMGDDDWGTAANWSLGTVPDDANTNAYVPNVYPNPQPYIYNSDAWQVASLYCPVAAGPNVVLVQNNGWLKVAESFVGNVGFFNNYDRSVPTEVTGSVELNGTPIHVFGGSVFKNKRVFNFTTNSRVYISPVANDGVKVVGELGFGPATNTTLNTGPSTLTNEENITLISTVTGTANVAPILNSNVIIGDVTVERYINTGTGTGEHTKKWQLLATPTGANSSGQSIYNSWMEGGITPPSTSPNGYGTNIADTRSNWAPLGFDEQSVNSDDGINIYNTISQDFDPIPSPGTSIPLYNKTGYFLFVRGDRSVNDELLQPNPTNLRSKGALFQPHTGYRPADVDVPATASATSPQFAMIGNPYASAIDISYMNSNTGYFNNLTNDVYIWDPLLAGAHGLGGYQTLVESLGYQAEPGTTALYDYHTTSYPEIQSGQAFFMTTNANSTAGSVHFDEAVKSPNSRLVTRNANISNKTVLKARLYFNQKITDGNAVIFDNAYSNKIDANDAIKFPNPGENFMIRTANHLLAAETRKPVAESDSIFYELKNIEPVPYQLQFVPENFNTVGLQAFLIDNHLHTKTPLSLSENSLIDFKADNNKASYEHRFIVVFQRSSNPEAKASDIKPAFVIYPNPVSERIINIRPANQASGDYAIQLVSRGGQVVYNGTIDVKDANTINSIKIGKVAAGNYDVIITAIDGKKSIHQILIK